MIFPKLVVIRFIKIVIVLIMLMSLFERKISSFHDKQNNSKGKKINLGALVIYGLLF